MSDVSISADVRKLVALACEYGAPIDVVFEKGGDTRISVYPTHQAADSVNPAALSARATELDAAISSEKTTRSIADDSLLVRIQAIEAHLGVAYIETEVTARAEADGVFASQVNLYDIRNPSHKPDDPSTWEPA